jgi:NitT/TauT family transport system ATP-binding protein
MSPTEVSAGAAPAIQFDDVSLRFISGDGTATVTLRNFTMAVARGEFVAIVGPTGCGKSTTLNMITGLLQPTVGEVQVMGQPSAGSTRASASCFRPTRSFRGAA